MTVPSIDPKELKTLSDILALVLEDQPGQSSSALEALRARARRSGITGGALKNLFVAIANEPPPRPRPATPRAGATDTAAGVRRTGTKATAEVQAAHVRIAQLAADVRSLDIQLRTANASVASLQAELDATRQARADAQASLRRFEHMRQEARVKAATIGGMAGGAIVLGAVLVLEAAGVGF